MQASGANNSLLFAPLFYLGLDMLLCELFESKTNKKKIAPPSPRNFVAKNAPKTGAGPHSPKKYTRKEKHKSFDSGK